MELPLTTIQDGGFVDVDWGDDSTDTDTEGGYKSHTYNSDGTEPIL